ncbi:RsmB/NOP family class I SAM-dependent RNA methyltransferase [Proteiniborus sp. MB09-C3]|uniref:RsmF rRNA methyltransferase first C-terminal domain-containing protein n=1 Tax=Proteiniborus sp. MB09-C3 TaxID=3050072 RepID=UPI0025535E9D|nr:RsmB/NOP family class I SAM-dependent RNA methyltransferase [Proteiniborus sp. MB09-C3]WIV13853.1 RsmB/NOP family class I SAM-dependent RNA methyltransferase [Proteiniborus sp. MB09-C3]
MKLPLAFTEKMEKLLGDEYNQFISTYDNDHYKGIRINTIKASVEEYLRITPFDLKPIPWIEEGFYNINYEEQDRPGKHPHYHCGLYYIQEPSAMIPVEVLDPRPGDKVLDISAAPGGKSTQIGAKLQGEGVLVANDISPKRTKALVKNIEIFGIKNSIVTNEEPRKLASNFEEYFDKILVDAPCSGEGMFRRDPKATRSWSEFSVNECCNMQKDILQWIPKLLKPGGRLVYSTCTFSPEENEGTIDWFLKKFPEFEIENIEGIEGLDVGRPQWIQANSELIKAGRAWPHKLNGEGHFVALLRKKDNPLTASFKSFSLNKKDLDEYLRFEEENLIIDFKDRLHRVGNRLYAIPCDIPELTGINVVNTGLYIGEFLKNRFEPSQALAMALKKEEVVSYVDISSESIEAIKYLKGETLLLDGEKGWKLVCIDGYPVGWGKQIQGSLKNYYRSQWRML